MPPTTSSMESLIARCRQTSRQTSRQPEIRPQLQLSDSKTVFPDHAHDTALPVVRVRNDRCEATIAVQGAQLLTFRTTAGIPLLWLSPKAIFLPGKAIRGGIPVCLPWFGPHPTDSRKPQHGFARNRDWALVDAEAVDSGTTRLVWELHYPDPKTDLNSPHLSLFEGQFRARLTMTLTDHISLLLTVQNTGDTSLPLSWALHSYHPVADAAKAEISGLDQCVYWDNANRPTDHTTPVTQRAQQHQSGNVRFEGEVDRVYGGVPPAQQLHGGTRTLTVAGDSCHSAIVWNPGAALATQMADVGAEHYREFVCLERGNTAEHSLQLAPGEVHRASLTIQVQD